MGIIPTMYLFTFDHEKSGKIGVRFESLLVDLWVQLFAVKGYDRIVRQNQRNGGVRNHCHVSKK